MVGDSFGATISTACSSGEFSFSIIILHKPMDIRNRTLGSWGSGPSTYHHHAMRLAWDLSTSSLVTTSTFSYCNDIGRVPTVCIVRFDSPLGCWRRQHAVIPGHPLAISVSLLSYQTKRVYLGGIPVSQRCFGLWILDASPRICDARTFDTVRISISQHEGTNTGYLMPFLLFLVLGCKSYFGSI